MILPPLVFPVMTMGLTLYCLKNFLHTLSFKLSSRMNGLLSVAVLGRSSSDDVDFLCRSRFRRLFLATFLTSVFVIFDVLSLLLLLLLLLVVEGLEFDHVFLIKFPDFELNTFEKRV